ncbi:MAG: photosynthetic complex putative assembly protein PuhB [Pseudomonadota bacterium]
MDLNPNPSIGGSKASAGVAGYGIGEIPESSSEAIFRRAENEEVLWRGRPDFGRLAATAFHTNSVLIYFAVLAIFAYVTDGFASALTLVALGICAFLILAGLAYLYAKKSVYILTNQRLVLVSGIALEKRISIPLRHVSAAHLKRRGKGYGSVALEITGARQLGYLILWPHARPLRFLKPQPLLRVIPEVEKVAKLLAEARAEFSAIESNLTQVKESISATDKQEDGPAADRAHPDALIDRGLSGAPA